MRPNSTLSKLLLLATVVATTLLAGVRTANADSYAARSPSEMNAVPSLSVLPTPRVVRFQGEWVPLGGATIAVYVPASVVRACGALGPAADGLVRARLMSLGAGGQGEQAGRGRAAVTIRQVTRPRLDAMIVALDGSGMPDGEQVRQAYVIETSRSADGAGRLTVTACSGVGLHYGCVTACQLLDRNEIGEVVLPVVRIADWPAIGLRLAKASASLSSLNSLREYAQWLPACRLNVMGLQYHGDDSRDPGPFLDNVGAICGDARWSGILETIVYFCPFRGGGERSYDFTDEADREAYASRLRWFMEQGAHGIEVDYNDWPNFETPIESVLNLACEALAAKHPEGYVLYCPPLRGESQYRGPATPEMARILAAAPEKVWPLWTGPKTLITEPLAASEIEAWTTAAGRRPFLWVNRVSPGAQFSREVPEMAGAHVFRGEFLPRNLGDLVEGVHLNTAITRRPEEHPDARGIGVEAEAYLATAADFLWNPGAWDAATSVRNARRLVSIMGPLLGQGAGE